MQSTKQRHGKLDLAIQMRLVTLASCNPKHVLAHLDPEQSPPAVSIKRPKLATTTAIPTP